MSTTQAVADTDGSRLLACSLGMARLTAATIPMTRITAGAMTATTRPGLVAGGAEAVGADSVRGRICWRSMDFSLDATLRLAKRGRERDQGGKRGGRGAGEEERRGGDGGEEGRGRGGRSGGGGAGGHG